jgi:polyhydroxybutyrate depolymerase
MEHYIGLGNSLMRYLRSFFLFVLVALLGTAFVSRPVQAFDELRLETRDGVRTTLVLSAQRGPAPTLIVLHGATISADLTARWSGFAEAAAGKGFVAAFPEGIYRLWNDGRNDGLATADDVGFLRQLTAKLVERRVTDPARVYLAGISNGGMMTLRMLCEAPEPFAGAATVVANMPANVGARCHLKKSVPILMFNGTADPIVPYKGGEVGRIGRYGRVWSAERSASFLAHGNGCGEPVQHQVPNGKREEGIKVVRLDWSSCRSGSPVALYRIEGGGHQLFGETNILPPILGPGTNQISTTALIMAAFTKQ